MVLAAAHGEGLWFLARGSGAICLLLLTGSVALGILTTKRWAASERMPRFVTGDLHRNVSLLALVFLFVHIASVVIDGYVPIGWSSAVVPFVSPYRWFWLGIGAIATDLMLAAAITSALRRRMSYAAWRYVHLASYAAWPIAVGHTFGTGTDRWEGWMFLLIVGSLCLLIGLLSWRLAPGPERAAARRRERVLSR